MEHIREFNKGAYDHTDHPCKVAAVNLMTAQGYVLKGDVDDENYKKWDLKFFHPKNKREIIIENEMRENFHLLKTKFSTIHVPARKKSTPADYYIVWNQDLNEMALIENKFLSSSPIIEINCKARGNVPAYKDKMLDVHKKNIIFYKKVGRKWQKEKI